MLDATITVRGLDVDGEPIEESLNVPRLSPEEEAAAARAAPMLRKIQRGAYRTRRRMAKAERRYLRATFGPASLTTARSFAYVSEIVASTFEVAPDATISFGFAALTERAAQEVALALLPPPKDDAAKPDA